VTAWLSRVYAKAGYEVLGGPDGMLDGFKSLLPDGGTVLVSEESADYRPEMDWLTRELGAGMVGGLRRGIRTGRQARSIGFSSCSIGSRCQREDARRGLGKR
jgi:hypothetical protein